MVLLNANRRDNNLVISIYSHCQLLLLHDIVLTLNKLAANSFQTILGMLLSLFRFSVKYIIMCRRIVTFLLKSMAVASLSSDAAETFDYSDILKVST